KKTTNVVFRLVADDGARLLIDDKLVVDNGGKHALEAKDAELVLKAGKHPFKLEYYQHGFGKGLSLQWLPYGAKDFVVVPPSVFTFKGSDIKKSVANAAAAPVVEIPGDGAPLLAVHPSFTLSQARPDSFQPKVGGMDFLPDGRLVVSTWDSLGSVFIVDGRKAASPKDIQVKRIASGLAEPLGIKVVDKDIYVMQKQELTRLVDTNQDDVIDNYETVCNGWKVSANFHEFAFGLVYRDGYFYGTLATAINPGGASTNPQIPDRGKVVKIAKKDGSFTLESKGLRTPNGIGLGVDNEIFIADNQGDWLPASKIVHYQENAWYGSRSVDFAGTANLNETLPVVWLPQDDIGNSPSQPAKLDVGPYKNQMIHGDVTHGGIKRVFAEKVNGAYQGVVFRFTQGLEAGVNRLAWGPDGALYVGGVGSTGNWGHMGKLSYGLQKLTFNNAVAFEMLAVRARPNGVEIEFTEPLKAGSGEKASDYGVRQWFFKPTADYGGPKLDDKALAVKSVTVSADRRKVLLELPGMQARHVVYIRLNKKTLASSSGKNLWATEAWYTMNSIPAN
ncbi:MAG: PA14 domain-containing protein, partial [Adhaeribacter sp.]